MNRLDVARREALAVKAALEDDDAQLLADMIEGSTDFNEIISGCARRAHEFEAMADALKIIEEQHKARRERFLSSADALRNAIGRAMLDVELPKVTAPDLTISVRIGAPRLKVVSEDMLSAEFKKTKTITSPDMEKISDYAADHPDLPAGVIRTNGSLIVTLRSK